MFHGRYNLSILCQFSLRNISQHLYKVTQKKGTFEKSKHVKHFYGDSTLLTIPLIHDS
jgi:hypothetical protein